MENTEIMEKAIDTTEEVVNVAEAVDLANMCKIAGGIGLLVGAGYAMYRFVLKPRIIERNARKAAEASKHDFTEGAKIIDEASDKEEPIKVNKK